MSKAKKRIAVFASGSGSNAERFFEHFKNSPVGEIALVCCNNPDAFVLKRAKKHRIPSFLFTNQEIKEGTPVVSKLQEEKIDFVVLAGFLRLIPASIVAAYPDRIVNIHPALLPKWGGKGMYGSRVHESVVKAGDLETGITIHLVNNQYDEGNVIFQASCPVSPGDGPEEVAQKVHKLEHEHYPLVVDRLLRKLMENSDN